MMNIILSNFLTRISDALRRNRRLVIRIALYLVAAIVLAWLIYFAVEKWHGWRLQEALGALDKRIEAKDAEIKASEAVINALKTEIAAKDGERLRQWNETPGRVRMPSGEALRDVRQRSLSAVRVLATRHGGDVICVVSHEIVIKVIVAEVLGMDYDHLMRFAIDNCAVTTVDYDGRVGQVITLNDMTHLAADR